MIFESGFSVITSLLSWVFESMPAWTFLDAQWYEQATTFWTENVVRLGFQMATWLPVSAIGTIATAYIAFVVIQFTIIVLRLVLSLFTGGGGR